MQEQMDGQRPLDVRRAGVLLHVTSLPGRGDLGPEAYRFVDFALSAPVQKAFCEKMFYGAVNSKVEYSPSLANRLPRPDEINVPSERFMADNMSNWITRWNREIVG